ncbi:carbohydrate ABC transporter membrane protein 1 (CUT1 family) [Anaerobacterium chartisolvens]|uniref:Carbohydrate ABC transporter membrane protein 1 (CUT1 family) n=1 Tax=Anaerobacterium chartisolvens TaxID=1297424 RepID=A0A369BE95_9FIRM|nr:sugar ABC transporter permease [Anaerobacterium chartisolvens]RCX18797.1 carbohydrate ABC transporter membrane protein 1 (CUT1 family) [Anaerobacterium chartisolvens]
MKAKNLLYPKYLTYPAILVFGVFFILPVAAAFILSFYDWNIDRLLTPKFIGFENFKYIFGDEYFILSARNTLVYAIITSFMKILLGLALAVVLNMQLRGRNILRTIFYLPAALSYIVVGLVFSSIFRMDGMFNNMLAGIGLAGLQTDWLGNGTTALYCACVAEIWKWSGFTMAIFIAGLQSISSDYYESARIDGASSLQQFIKITLPLLKPAISVNVTIAIIGGLKVFDSVFVMTGGGPGFASQVLNTYVYKAFGEGTLGRSSAMGIMLFIAIFIISSISNNLTRRGVE